MKKLDRLNAIYENYLTALDKIEAQEETIVQLTEICPLVAEKFKREKAITEQAAQRLAAAFYKEKSIVTL